MARQKAEPNSLPMAILGALVVIAAMVAVFLAVVDHKAPSEALAPSPQPASRPKTKNEGSFVENLLHSMFSEEPSAAPSQKPSAPPIHFSDVLAADDACLYHHLTDLRAARRDYFATTSFNRDYAEYDDVVSGYESAVSRFGEFYLGLAYAHWLSDGEKQSPYKRSYARAGRMLLALARGDQGNAAPAAWALLALEEALKENDPTMGISISELEEAQDYIKFATRFDSYTLEHLRKMAALNDPRAVAFLVRIDYHRTLAIPNWTEFLTRLKSSPHVSLENRIRLSELIANNAKNATRPSTAYGYSPLELKIAEKLAENARPIPTAEDIDKTFPTHRLSSSKEIVESPNGPCPPPDSDIYRKSLLDHMKSLKEAGVDMGLSL